MNNVLDRLSIMISMIPDVVWSGLIASFLTLGGVLLSNKSNTARLLLQLRHDAENKKNERQTSIRREIYLDFIESLTGLNFFIASLTKEDLATLSSEPVKRLQSSASKILLVGTAKTVQHANELTTLYVALYMKAMEKAVPAGLERSSISTKTALRERYNTEIARIISQMTALNESGKPNEAVFGALSVSFDGQCELRDQLSDEIDSHWKRYNSICMEYAEFIVLEVRALLRTQAETLASLRNELDFELGENELLSLLEKQYAILQRHGETLLTNLKKLA